VASEFKLPELGENIESGDVVRVAVAPGDAIQEGQTLIELETDKAVIEVPSDFNGVIDQVRVKDAQSVRPGEVLLTYTPSAAGGQTAQKEAGPGKAGEAEAQAAQEAASAHEAVEAPEASFAASHKPDASSTAANAATEEALDASDEGYMAIARHSFYSARTAEGKSEPEAFPPDSFPEMERQQHPPDLKKHAGEAHRTVPAAPIVRKLAREIGVDIYQVQGTGPGGRIGEDDVKAFAKAKIAQLSTGGAGAGAAAVELPDFSRWGKVEKVSLRGVRRRTAEHLSVAWNTIPHVTHFDKADVSGLEELRQRFGPKAEKAGGKMTMTAIALKVAASALKAFPQFNASIDMARGEIIYKHYIHIGVAVDTERGLLVPVIRDVDKKNIIELAVELSALSQRAREKKLAPEEMEGGSFTITNLGGVGGTAFTPIVNYPEVAILGLARELVEPVWVEDKFEPHKVLPLALSYDHRMIDGADAARFLRWIVDALEQPFLLSVQG
jgi:pyruvate dehydrogenase E2 component (dihydrolipoamide acetyltransferase)